MRRIDNLAIVDPVVVPGDVIYREDAEEFVRQIYGHILDREPDALGLEKRTEALLHGYVTPGQLVGEILHSDESKARAPTMYWTIERATEFVETMYEQLLCRRADPPGLNMRTAELVSGMKSPDDVVSQILTSAEFRARISCLEEEAYWSSVRSQEFVRSLYRVFLRREPDEIGLKAYTEQLRTNGPEQVIAAFVGSQEFERRCAWSLWETRESVYRLELSANPHELEALWRKTSQYWVQAGEEAGETYFSVLADDQYRRELDRETKARFFETGHSFVDLVVSQVDEYLGATSPCKAMDFGAGVGRLSFPASKVFTSVLAVDFSAGHLDCLRQNMTELDSLHNGNIDTMPLGCLEDLDRLPRDFDVIFSFITLQHNTPPVIGHLVSSLLKCLKQGGIAVLHVPIHHPFYSFSIPSYLDSPVAGTAMEMHILPRENLRDLAADEGCSLVDSHGFGGNARSLLRGLCISSGLCGCSIFYGD